MGASVTPAHDVAGPRPPDSRAVVVVLGVILGATFMVRAWLLPRLNVNWDEFFFLSKVHLAQRGALDSGLLTFHVHLLSWVTKVSTHEVDQVMALRALMFALGVGIAVGLVVIGRRLFGGVVPGLVAAVLWSSFSLVAHHGSSARFDPLIAAAVVGAVALLLANGRATLVGAGVLVALAALVSPKAVFLAPALLAALWWRVRRDARVVDAALFAFVVVIVGGALWVWHLAGLVAPPSSTVAVAGVTRPSAPIDLLTRVLAELLPQRTTLLRTLRFDAGFWVIVAVGIGLALRARIVRRDVGVVVIGGVAPLVSVLVYRNAFAYFYATLVPLAAIAVGVVVVAIGVRFRARPALHAALVIALCVPSLVALGRFVRWNGDDEVTRQRVVLDVVHEVFPTPVSYIDRCAMVASHEKVGPFMSTWVMQTYRDRGEPIMRELLRTSAPLYLLENIEGLELDDPRRGRPAPRGSRVAERLLLPEDWAVLADHFVPHWGPLQVAGRQVTLLDNDADVEVELLFGGDWRVEADGVVRIDGVDVAPGTVVRLDAGMHRVGRPAGSTTKLLTLRTAAAGPAPAIAPPTGPLFSRLGHREGPRPPRRRSAASSTPPNAASTGAHAPDDAELESE